MMSRRVESLNESIEAHKREKYDASLERDVRAFLASMLEDPSFNTTQSDLTVLLKDGTALCKVVNKLVPGCVGRINTSMLPFKQMENISAYLKACEQLGFNRSELFDTTDLFEAKDFMKVLINVNVVKHYKEKYDAETLKKRFEDNQSRITRTAVSASSGDISLKRAAIASPAAKRVAGSAPSSPAKSPLSHSGGGYEFEPGSPIDSPSRTRPSQMSVTSLQDDIAMKEEFKYSFELEAIVRRWIEATLQEPLPFPDFGDSLVSGVVLCKLINKVQPGSVDKINNANNGYSKMENIERYLKACRAFGMRETELFNTVDLYEKKNMSGVLTHLTVLGNKVKRTAGYNGPIIEENKKAKTLWAQSLAMNDLSVEEDLSSEPTAPLIPEQQELVDWVNNQLAKASPPVAITVRNLVGDFKSGIVLIKLLECLLGSKVEIFHDEPRYLWQYIANASTALRFLTSATFEVVQGCNARDVVSGRASSIQWLLSYLRDKFDLEFLFIKILTEQGGHLPPSQGDEDVLYESDEDFSDEEMTAGDAEAGAEADAEADSDESAKHFANAKAEAERIAAAEQEAKREAEQARVRAEEARKQAAMLALKRQEEEEALARENKRLEAEAELKRRAEEAEAQRRAEEKARKRKAEEDARKKAEAAEAERKRKLEEAEMKKAAKAEAKRRAAEAEAEAALRRAQEAKREAEERARRAVEKKERKRAEKEAAAQKKAALEAEQRHLKLLEEEKRRKAAEDEARRQKEAEEAVKRAAEEAARAKKLEEEAAEAKRQAAEEAARQKAALLAAAEAEQKRKQEEAAIQKRKQEEEEEAQRLAQRAAEEEAEARRRIEALQEEARLNAEIQRKGAPPKRPPPPVPSRKKVAANDQAATAAGVGSSDGKEKPPVPPVSAKPRLKSRKNPKDIRRKPAGQEEERSFSTSSANLVEEVKLEKARYVVRKRVVSELLATEESYSTSLQTVVQKLLIPLRATKILSAKELDTVFMNIEQLSRHHTSFLEQLRARIAGDAWSDSDTVLGDLFLGPKIDFIRDYAGYLNKYNTALISMRHFSEKRPEFRRMKEVFETDLMRSSCLALDAYLIMPVQRIPRYLLLLKEMGKYTGASHPDHNLVEKALAYVKSIMDELNRNIDRDAHLRIQKIISIEDSIQGLQTELYHPDRFLVREGLVTLKITNLKDVAGGKTLKKAKANSLKQAFYLFLFNDLLVCCGKLDDSSSKSSSSSSGGGIKTSSGSTRGGGGAGAGAAQHQFSVAAIVELRTIEHVRDGPAPPHMNLVTKIDPKLVFHFVTDSQAWTLVGSGIDDKTAWVVAFAKYFTIARSTTPINDLFAPKDL
eukprot:TRINITY_DN8355_c0_g1_i1.p1 TRINITY_DN8355_c0_g1~~TRINITY_DN8355_c0_g1_i1.p1  ORF type:complete len:1335 (-),score=374.38 TRINITY_DN8355_c0_g1_i1:61-4065(-)